MNYKHFIIIAVGALCLACSHSANKAAAVAAHAEADSVRLELPLPVVPSSITSSQERAAYILQHFWDSLDFADTVRSLQNDLIEQNFSNFAALLPLADADAQSAAVSRLLARAAAEPKALKLMITTARKYLYDPNSPMFSEQSYAVFVESALSRHDVDSAEQQRLSTERRWIAKNRPGTLATDIKYRTADGTVTTLHKTPVHGEMLLILYDPTCDHCQEILKSYADDSEISRGIADGELTVLAINLVPDEKPYNVPAAWISGTDLSAVEDNDLYIIRATPTIFLLDDAHKVLVKDLQPTASH
jgi:hypothetical protein